MSLCHGNLFRDLRLPFFDNYRIYEYHTNLSKINAKGAMARVAKA